MVGTTCWSSIRASKLGRSNLMTLNVAPLLAPDRVTISGTAGLPGLCHPSPEFKEKGFRKKKISSERYFPCQTCLVDVRGSEARIKKKNLKETTWKHWSVLLFLHHRFRLGWSSVVHCSTWLLFLFHFGSCPSAQVFHLIKSCTLHFLDTVIVGCLIATASISVAAGRVHHFMTTPDHKAQVIVD